MLDLYWLLGLVHVEVRVGVLDITGVGTLGVAVTVAVCCPVVGVPVDAILRVLAPERGVLVGQHLSLVGAVVSA